MEHSSSGSTNSDPKQVNASAGENNDTRPADANDVNNQRMVADRLLAALVNLGARIAGEFGDDDYGKLAWIFIDPKMELAVRVFKFEDGIQCLLHDPAFPRNVCLFTHSVGSALFA